MTVLTIPSLALVALVGPSGSGKSTFARRHFRPTEVLSSDACRALVSDDENNQAATKDAFDVLHYIADKRLAAGRLTVVDATNVQPEARRPLLLLARRHYVQPVAIVFNLPEALLLERARLRTDRRLDERVIHRHVERLQRSLHQLHREGFRPIYVLSSVEEIEAAEIRRQPLRVNRRWDHGPFDIVGDVHGCFDELAELLDRLGYQIAPEPGGPGYAVTPPEGRRLVFLGDLVDRGPRIPDVLRLAMGMVEAGTALCVPGNHDDKLRRKLMGRDVRIAHGLANSLAQLEREPPELRERVLAFFSGLPSHYVLDGGRLVVAHAGMKREMQGRDTPEVRDFALYGETTGEVDEFGLPVRLNWAADYRGRAAVVYGHTPVMEPTWLNNTINIDTGCVFGGRLTALRYPERELVSVAARRVYAPPGRPFLPPPVVAVEEAAPPRDVTGTRVIDTRLRYPVAIGEEELDAARAALRDSDVDPRWVIYLPPRAVPPRPSARPGVLEHPEEALAFYEREGIERVVCQEMVHGTRVVVVVARDGAAAQRRFGVPGSTGGACYDRTARRPLPEPELEADLLERLRGALTRADLWASCETDWVCLDGVLASVPDAPLGGRRFAPLALLASERAVHARRTRLWHLERVEDLCRAGDSALMAAPFREVHLADPASRVEALEWWEAIVRRGGYGMVVSPVEFVARGRHGLLPPAIACHAPEALRATYGPDYDAPGRLERLRTRPLTAYRALAVREFALGLEALERFVAREAPERVRECVLGVLALEREAEEIEV